MDGKISGGTFREYLSKARDQEQDKEPEDDELARRTRDVEDANEDPEGGDEDEKDEDDDEDEKDEGEGDDPDKDGDGEKDNDGDGDGKKPMSKSVVVGDESATMFDVNEFLACQQQMIKAAVVDTFNEIGAAIIGGAIAKAVSEANQETVAGQEQLTKCLELLGQWVGNRLDGIEGEVTLVKSYAKKTENLVKAVTGDRADDKSGIEPMEKAVTKPSQSGETLKPKGETLAKALAPDLLKRADALNDKGIRGLDGHPEVYAALSSGESVPEVLTDRLSKAVIAAEATLAKA